MTSVRMEVRVLITVPRPKSLVTPYLLHTMNLLIQEQIAKVFTVHKGIPLFYIESGSRLWNIASPNSDYDVRGFHLQSQEQYYDFRKHRDVIEVMDGDFDFVSYDLDKMFGLLAQGNPNTYEWIRAHLIYFNALPDWSSFSKELTNHLNFSNLYYHYFSLAKTHWKLLASGNKFTYKVVFYCLRGLLSADIARQGILPELTVEKLFDQFDTNFPVLSMAKESLERKQQELETQEVAEAERGSMVRVIQEYMSSMESNQPRREDKAESLERMLREYNFQLKNQFYR
ncbi:putative nucleotidyltransferase [Siphonobacter sp. SORGH_AS 1065]|nr:putative nucleotidyltransferase [Siphonobacter sp. SORGH_AS_1065]